MIAWSSKPSPSFSAIETSINVDLPNNYFVYGPLDVMVFNFMVLASISEEFCFVVGMWCGVVVVGVVWWCGVVWCGVVWCGGGGCMHHAS